MTACAILVLLVAVGGSGVTAPAAAEEKPAPRIEEVVVTARRREEPAQRSSLALEVIAGPRLERAGLDSIAALDAAVPGLEIGAQGGISQIYLRGIGDYSANGFAQTGVAFNVDGVYMARAEANRTDFFDLERIEVLKGPQGTLYGRNATGGAINLVTRRPRFEREVRLEGEVGSHDLVRLGGAVNEPLTETLAVRGAFEIVDRDGHLSDGSDDDVHQGGRVRLFWQPAPEVSLLVNGGFAHVGGAGAGGAILPAQGDPWLGPASPEVNAFLDRQSVFGAPGGGALLANLDDDGLVDSDFWNASAELAWDLGFAKLTLIPAYRGVDSNYRTYGYGFFAEQHDRSDQTTVEARLARDGERVHVVGGAYGFFEEQELAIEVNLGDPFIDHLRITVPELSSRSWALFGETTVDVVSGLRWIGGVRYTSDHRRTEGFFDYVTLLPILPQTDFAFDGEIDDDAFTWKTGLECDLSQTSMLFATVATGFKSGGFFQARATPTISNTFAAETVLAYTLGSRNRFLDDRLELNVEAFHWKYEDQQVAHLGIDADKNLNFVTDNAGEATLYGVDLDLSWLVTDADLVGVGVEWLHSRYDEFVYTQPTGFASEGSTTGCQVTTTGVPVILLGTDTVDCSGFALPHAPRWAGFASWQHTLDLAAWGAVVASVDAQFASARWLTVDFVSNGRDDAYVVENASLTYRPSRGAWSAGAWVRNIGDEAVYRGGFQGLAPNVIFASIDPPRTYGGRVTITF